MSRLPDKQLSLLQQEIVALQRQDGSWAPDDLVDFARSHPESQLHKQYPWDVDAAAHQHWLLISRNLIKTHVRSIGKRNLTVEVGRVISVPSLRGPGQGSYLSDDAVSGNEAYRIEVLEEIKSKLISMRSTYSTLLPELDPVWRAIKRST